MATRKSRNTTDEPRPNRVAVMLSDEVLARVDAWRATTKQKRAQAAALLIERALDAQPAKATAKATG